MVTLPKDFLYRLLYVIISTSLTKCATLEPSKTFAHLAATHYSLLTAAAASLKTLALECVAETHADWMARTHGFMGKIKCSQTFSCEWRCNFHDFE